MSGSSRFVWELSRAILANHDGYVVVLKTYMDESGIHDGSPVLTVGAYIGLGSIWRDWTKEWNRQKKPIKVFHATDCAALENEFKGWDPKERDKYVANLLPVIGRANLIGTVAGIVMDDYREVQKQFPEIVEKLGNPYTACFQWVVQNMLESMVRVGQKKRVAFFHENNDYKEDALQCFAFLKKHRDPNNQLISLTFGGKEDYTPLQAADVLAYEGNKRLRNFERPDRRAWTAINPKGNRRRTMYFNKKNLTDLMQDFRKNPHPYAPLPGELSF